MKILTNKEIIFIIENICEQGHKCLAGCPFEKECLYYYTGEKCGSALESQNEEDDLARRMQPFCSRNTIIQKN